MDDVVKSDEEMRSRHALDHMVSYQGSVNMCNKRAEPKQQMHFQFPRANE